MIRKKFPWKEENDLPSEWFDLDRSGKMDDFDDFRMPSGEKKVKCIYCEWEGQLKDCKLREVSTPRSSWRALAGREGWEWDCPRCKFTVHHHYTMVS